MQFELTICAENERFICGNFLYNTIQCCYSFEWNFSTNKILDVIKNDLKQSSLFQAYLTFFKKKERKKKKNMHKIVKTS